MNSKLAQRTKNLGLGFATFYAVITGAMFVMQDKLIFPAPAQAAPMPLVPGMARVAIPTPDGQTLDGWHIAPAKGKPPVLTFHGSVGRGQRHAELGASFAAKGFGYLSATFRGYAPSTGKASEAGLLADGLALFDWAKRECQCDIVILGNSLGSGVGVHTAKERSALALILTSPYSSVADVAAGRYPFLPVRQLIRHEFPSTEWVGSVAEPLLILHGEQDRTVPFQYAKRLHAAAPAGARLDAYPELGHELKWTLDIAAVTERFIAELPSKQALK